MKSSSFIKLLLILLFGAGLSPVTLGQQKTYAPGKGPYTMAIFDTAFGKALYKGSLDISKHHLSGLFYLKRVSGNSARILFSNEIGINFFDLEITDGELIVHSCFPSLNRASLLKLLKNDFRMLLFPDTTVRRMKRARSKDPEQLIFGVASARGSFRYTYDRESGKILRIRTSRSGVGKTDLRVYGDDRLQPKKILITNPVIRLHIRMNFLSN
jgi:hypothetical protein